MDSLNMDTMVHFVIKCALTKNILYITIKKKKRKMILIKGFAQTWSKHASASSSIHVQWKIHLVKI